ncbi:MAG: hypothetical protein ACFFBD_21435 [Candidatus Hodarchaeota archaeon]
MPKFRLFCPDCEHTWSSTTQVVSICPNCQKRTKIRVESVRYVPFLNRPTKKVPSSRIGLIIIFVLGGISLLVTALVVIGLIDITNLPPPGRYIIDAFLLGGVGIILLGAIFLGLYLFGFFQDLPKKRDRY